jgi:hypothetical protein
MKNVPTTETVKRRSNWVLGDWVKVVKHIDENNPGLMIASTGSINGIRAKHIEAAQNAVIDNWKHRKTFQISIFKRQLEEAAAYYHAQVQEAAQSQKEEVAPVQEPAAAEVNAYEQAFKPLIALIAAEVVRQQQPQLDRMEELLKGIQRNAMYQGDAVMIERSLRQEPYAGTERRDLQTRKARVGIIGMMSVQAQAIERCFPHLQFVFIESTTEAEVVKKVQTCDRVIGLARFAHKIDTHLRKTIPTRYTSINGTTGETKRTIDFLITSGMLPKPEMRGSDEHQHH